MKTLIPTLALSLSLAASAHAQTIDFEAPPVPGPWAEGTKVSQQFAGAPFFITFELLDGSPATLADVGGERTAFQGPNEDNGSCGFQQKTRKDMPADGQDVGCFFLTDDGLVGGGAPAPEPIRIRYLTPVLQASGDLIDVDNGENFTVSAFGIDPLTGLDSTIPIATDLIQAKDPDAGEGKATRWEFDVSEPIHSIVIERTKGTTKGIAFDNFSTSSLCPTTVDYYGEGLGANGFTPAISVGCPTVGGSGTLEIFNGRPGAPGCLIVGFSKQSMDFGCGKLEVTKDFTFLHTLNGPLGLPGQGRHSISYGPIDSSLAGQTLYLQAAYFDDDAPCGVTLSRAVEVRF